MTGDWRRYDSSNNGRTSKCSECGAEIGVDQVRFWNKNTKAVRCEACQGKEPQATTPATQPTTHRCEVCGDPTPTVITLRMQDWSSVVVCPSCDWLSRAQFGLKCKGLWRPTPKPEPAKEGGA